MKKFFLLATTLFIALHIHAQDYVFDWSGGQFDNVLPNGLLTSTLNNPLSGLTEYAGGVVDDHNGDVITVSSFKGTYLDLPSITPVYETNGGTLAIQKRAANGQMIWARYIDGGNFNIPGAGRIVRDVAVDAQNNIFICGRINDTTDFDPGVGQTLGIPSSTFSGFVAKFTPNGNLSFVYLLEGGTDADPRSLSVDQNGEVLVTGIYEATVDFDGGSGSQLSSSANQSDDNFLLKISNSGQYIWHKVWGGSQPDDPVALELDTSGNAYVACQFISALDTDPGTGVNWLTNSYSGSGNSTNGYVSKFDPSGNLVWTSGLQSTGFNNVFDLACDGENVCVMGVVDGALDVGYGGTFGTVPAVSSNENVFVVKLDSAGHYDWHYSPQALTPSLWSFGTEIANHDDEWYFVLRVSQSADLDNGTGVNTVSSGNSARHLVHLSANGTFQWSKKFQLDAFGWLEFTEISIRGDDMYLTGNYEDAAFDTDPDPTQVAYLPMWYVSTVFLIKLDRVSPCNLIGPATGIDLQIACDSFTWIDGNTYTASTDTVTHTIVGGAANGCDSIATLDLTINTSTSSTVSATACDSYNWSANGVTYLLSGTYQTILTNSAGCDSNLTLVLTIKSSSSSVTNVTACGSYHWLANGLVYSNSGTYYTAMTNSVGCDSQLVLNLTIDSNVAPLEIVSSCGPYTWPVNGQSYSSSGFYVDTVIGGMGCVTIYSLFLNVNDTSSSTQTASSCDSYTWSLNGMTYTQSGTYSTILTNAAGCDSIVSLHLTIHPSNAISQTEIACGSYTWPVNGLTYTTSGTYFMVLTNAVGCDSILTLNLTINQANASSQTVTACNQYTWLANGMTYTSSGTYTATLVNTAGCDSVITLALTIDSLNTSVTLSGQTLTANANWVNYQWISCDFAEPIAGATSQSFSPTTNGAYAVVITDSTCSDTSDCYEVIGVGVEEVDLSDIQIYPNPTSDAVTIELPAHANIETIILNDMLGNLAVSMPVHASSGQLRLDLSGHASGVYLCSFINTKGVLAYRRKLVIQRK